MKRREFLKSTAAMMVVPMIPPQASAARITTIAGIGMAGMAGDGDPAEPERGGDRQAPAGQLRAGG